MATATVDGGDELRSAERERESRGGRGGMRERERAGGEEEGEGECERGWGGCVASPGHPDEEGRGQAGREGGGVARRSARASGTRPSSCRGGRRQRGGGRWAGPALAAGPARPHREEAQVSFSSFSVF